MSHPLTLAEVEALQREVKELRQRVLWLSHVNEHLSAKNKFLAAYNQSIPNENNY